MHKKIDVTFLLVLIKKFVFVIVIAFLMFSFIEVKAAAPDNWKWVHQEEGIFGGVIIGTIVDPQDSNIIYVLTSSKGVFKSIDGGSNWIEVNSGLPVDKQIFMDHLFGNLLTIDPFNHEILYIQINGKIYKTINGGNSWQLAYSGIDFTCGKDQIVGIIADPSTPNHLFSASVTTGCSGGLFESTDGATSWTQVAGITSAGSIGGIGVNDSWPVAIDPSSPLKMYVSTVHNENYKSIDGGKNWVSMTIPLAYYNTMKSSLVVHPTNHSIFLGTSNGVIVSADDGNTWTKINDFGNKNISVIKFSSSPSIAYAVATTGEIYKTENDGTSWSLKSTGVDTNWISLDIDSITPTTIYIGSRGNGIYKSTNSGVNITAINTGISINSGLPNTYLVNDYTQSLSNPDIVYLLLSNGIYRSSDGGHTWVFRSPVLEAYQFYLVVDPQNPNTLITIGATEVDNSKIYRSTDGGVNWTIVKDHLLAGSTIYGLSFAPSDSNIIYLRTGSNTVGILKSTDNGLTWLRVDESGLGTDFSNSNISINGTNPDILYFGNQGDKPYKSIDGGRTWTKLVGEGLESNGGTYSVSVSQYDSNLVFVGGQNSVLYRSDDGGETFSNVLDLGSFGDTPADPVFVSPFNHNLMYTGSYTKGSYISSDGGVSWSPIPNDGTLISAYFTRPNLGKNNEIFSTDMTSSFIIYENYIPNFSNSELLISNKNGGTEFHPEDIININLSVKNSGYSLANNIKSTFTLPQGINFIPDTAKVDSYPVLSDIDGQNISIHVSNAINSDISIPVSLQAQITKDFIGEANFNSKTYSDEDISGTDSNTVQIDVTAIPAVKELDTPHYSSGSSSIQSQVQNLITTGNLQLANSIVNQWPQLFEDKIQKDSTTPSNSAATFTFIKNLKYGIRHNEVKSLQQYLNKTGFTISLSGAGSSGKETNYFGPATRSALIKFQKAKNIKPAIGYFGPVTRNIINGN